MAKVPWEFESQPLTDQVHNLMIRVSERDKTIENQAAEITRLLARCKGMEADAEHIRKAARRRGIEFSMEQISALSDEWSDKGWPSGDDVATDLILHLKRYRDE